MIIIIRFLILLLSLTTSAWATVNVVRYPGGTPVAVCQASDSDLLCSGGAVGPPGPAYYQWNSISAPAQVLVNGNAYIATNSGLTTFSLPVSPAIGDHYIILGRGAGGWILAQRDSEIIYIGDDNTTMGVLGSLSSVNNRDGIELICVGTNEFQVLTIYGNINVV